MNADDLAAMGERHRPEPERRLIPICVTCLEDWPCDSRRLLDEVEALRGAAWNALVFLEGIEIPYKDRHRPLLDLAELVGAREEANPR